MKKIALISSLLLSLTLSGCVLDASGPSSDRYPSSGTTTFEPATPSNGTSGTGSSNTSFEPAQPSTSTGGNSGSTSFEPAQPNTSTGSSNTSFEPASSNNNHTSRPNY